MKTTLLIMMAMVLMAGCEEESIELNDPNIITWDINNSNLYYTTDANTEKWWVSEPNEPANIFRFAKESPQEVITLGVGEDGKLFVEGNLDEGAKLFFEEIVKPMADEYIREHCQQKKY